MPVRQIADLPKAKEIPMDENTPVAYADGERQEFVYTTIGEILRRCKPVYGHRNGEEEGPIVSGPYWFRGAINDREFTVEIMTNVLWDSGAIAWDDLGHSFLSTDKFQGQWWGPIVPPWEQGEDQ